MKYLLTTLLITISSLSFSQHKRDTIYFDRTWSVTQELDSAKYYRLIKEADNLYYVKDYFIHSDSIQMTGAFRDYAQKVKEGEFVYYNEQGFVSLRTHHKNGKLDGTYNKYYPSGELYYTDNFVNDVNHGDFIVYYQNGAIRRKETFVDGKQKFKACYLENGKKTKYFPYSTPATFPNNGMEGVKKYLAKNLKYPVSALRAGIEGKVYIQFVISETGEITNVTVKKSADPILDDEAVRIVKAMPKWNPGTIDGKPVNSVFSLPITFRL